MEKTYSSDKKKRLADKISKLKKKEDMVKILEIIYEDNKNITENQNGLFMFFHKLNEQTYYKIEQYIKKINKRHMSEDRSDALSDKKEYKSYSADDFPEQEKLNPKLKYSNKEKNIIKRQRYDEHLNNENNSESNIVYQKFNLNNSDQDST